MGRRPQTLLHRDDPSKAPLVGNVKVTREDWLNVAQDILVSEGVAEVKVLAISDRLGISRSSFYWYFQSRRDLLSALLDDWDARNTAVIVTYCQKDAATITEAVCNFFRPFIDASLFDPGLDFAVREWARRDGNVRARIDRADEARLRAVKAMFERFGYAESDADSRARILYFMQLGYHALDQLESAEVRMGRLEGYLLGFTGVAPCPEEVKALQAFAKVTLSGP